MMTEAELEYPTLNRSVPATSPVRGRAMQSYCTTLSRFTSSVQSTELMLRGDEANTHDDSEQRELTAASRLRGIEQARAAAAAGLEHGGAVRDRQGLPELELHDGLMAGTAGMARLSRGRRPGAGDLGTALAALARRRDELRLAETEFEQWVQQEDELSLRIVRGTCGVVGLIGAVIMFVAGSKTSVGGSLALLLVCVLAVTAATLVAGVVRLLPRLCAGPGLARVPDGASMARFGAGVAGIAALGLVAANITGGAL